MKYIAHQDEDYAVVIKYIYNGVDISVYNTHGLNEIPPYRCNDFNHYSVVPPNKLQKMVFGTYKSQIQSAVYSLINDIKNVHNENEVQCKKQNEIFECTKKTLISLYGE